MNPPTQSETLAALEAHHAKSRPMVNRLATKMDAPYWKWGCTFACQLVAGIRYDSGHVGGRRLRSGIIWLPGVTFSVLRSSQERYTQEELNSAGISHRCNLNFALAKEINKKEVELAGMVSVPDSERHP